MNMKKIEEATFAASKKGRIIGIIQFSFPFGIFIWFLLDFTAEPIGVKILGVCVFMFLASCVGYIAGPLIGKKYLARKNPSSDEEKRKSIEYYLELNESLESSNNYSLHKFLEYNSMAVQEKRSSHQKQKQVLDTEKQELQQLLASLDLTSQHSFDVL